VASGESLDSLVHTSVADGLSGIECLAGIPGTVGATPVQNVGAYGQEISQVLVAVDVWDWQAAAVRRIDRDDCGFTYRDSRFKREPDAYTIITVHLRLKRSSMSRPVQYSQLAAELGVAVGDTVGLRDAAEAVVAIRRRKGMVVDPADPESRSAGSFFLNPVIDDWESLIRAVPVDPPRLVSSDGRVRTSAGWLMERAGFTRGQRFGTARLSRKHPLALVAEDGTSAQDIHDAAYEIIRRVDESFGVRLEPEPRFVGVFRDVEGFPSGDAVSAGG
jgi:UDP-N-acetylmuramate dehydrogenase